MRPPIDLRSDTVTRPTPAMREAMAGAEVGDDVFGEDPTVNRLQEVVAGLIGSEAALFVPTGTMANQIAIAVHTRHGDEIIVGKGAHNWLYESGAAGALSGVQPCLVGDDGRFTAADLRAAFKADDHHRPPSRLVCVENTHNMGGGLLWDQAAVGGVLAAAAELGMASHLDGARLWNAAVAAGRPERELAAGFTTVSVCLSKGLGAPVGSLLCGPRALIHRAHRYRKMFGGGMRQAGVLAAAGLYAVEHHRQRLADDHGNARFLAEALAAVPGLSVDLDRVHSNIVMVEVAGEGRAARLVEQAGARGVLFFTVGPTRLRLVTHLDVDRAACGRAVDVIRELAAG